MNIYEYLRNTHVFEQALTRHQLLDPLQLFRQIRLILIPRHVNLVLLLTLIQLPNLCFFFTKFQYFLHYFITLIEPM